MTEGGENVKDIRITYLAVKGPSALTCRAVIPMMDQYAEELLEKQRHSLVLGGMRYNKGLLSTTLDRLAKLQGYGYADFVSAENNEN